MIYISEVISKRFLVDHNLPISRSHKDLSLTFFSPCIAVEFIRNLLRSFYFLQFTLGLVQWKIFEFEFWIYYLVSEIVSVYFLFIFGKNWKLVEICMPVKVERHFIKTELKDRRRWNLSQTFFLNYLIINLFFNVVIRLEYLLSIKGPPQKQILRDNPLLDLRSIFDNTLFVLVLVIDVIGHNFNSYFFQHNIDVLVDILQIRFN